MITPAQIAQFHRDGFLVLPGFYDLQSDIRPVQEGIHHLVGAVADRHGVALARPVFAHEAFDDGFLDLIAGNRAYGSEVYDAVKQIPAFVRLVADPRHEELMRALRPGSLPGIAAGGYGIRIDNPNEDKYRANWHQEYPAQLRSLDGIVLWSPLVPMTEARGPVRICVGSHRDGLRPVTRFDPRNPAKQGAYGLTLADEPEVVARYRQVAPLSVPGDLIIMDFLTLHESGANRSDRSRWSMQFRYFNFLEPTGQSHGWKGSFAAGVDFASIHPELVVGEPS
jgi:hypothetical protein